MADQRLYIGHQVWYVWCKNESLKCAVFNFIVNIEKNSTYENFIHR